MIPDSLDKFGTGDFVGTAKREFDDKIAGRQGVPGPNFHDMWGILRTENNHAKHAKWENMRATDPPAGRFCRHRTAGPRGLRVQELHVE